MSLPGLWSPPFLLLVPQTAFARATVRPESALAAERLTSVPPQPGEMPFRGTQVRGE
jgi:hypothetical protein